MANPYLYWNNQLAKQAASFVEPPAPAQKRGSVCSSDASDGTPQPPSYTTTDGVTHAGGTVRTRSIGGPFSTGVVFERARAGPPSDDEIIIVTVRLSNEFRKRSIGGGDELPSRRVSRGRQRSVLFNVADGVACRPPRRGFLRRVSTRWSGPVDEDRYKAIKMPRRDYKRYFARDKDRNYVGTEPEREWSYDQLMAEFGAYQDSPLQSVVYSNC